MKIKLYDQDYHVITPDNDLVSSLEDLLPLQLKLSRADDHEYYTALPEKIRVNGAASTMHVKAGWIYYFKDWNAFSINFAEEEIAPYSVYVVGEVVGGIEKVLVNSGTNVTITVTK